MKDILKKVDWFQVGVLGLTLATTLAKGIYENKKFDANLNKQYDEHFEKRVAEIVDKKLKKLK